MNHGPSRPARIPRSAQRRGAAGFTLVEAAVSIVIVGVMFVAALTTVGGAAQGRRVQAEWREADALGRSLLGEVAQCTYGTTGGSIVSLVILGGGGPQDRRAWTTLDDYSGLIDSPPSDRRGGKLSGLAAGWRREVAVERVKPDDPSGASTRSTDYGLKRITVTVTGPTGKQTVLTTLRSRWGLPEAAVAANTTRVQAASVHMRLVGGGEIHGGGLIANGATLAGIESLQAEPAPSGGLLGGLLDALLGGGK
jgi:type II secretory pathway pseudopilin PulG